jgi:hypothetical protein
MGFQYVFPSLYYSQIKLLITVWYVLMQELAISGHVKEFQVVVPLLVHKEFQVVVPLLV